MVLAWTSDVDRDRFGIEKIRGTHDSFVLVNVLIADSGLV